MSSPMPVDRGRGLDRQRHPRGPRALTVRRPRRAPSASRTRISCRRLRLSFVPWCVSRRRQDWFLRSDPTCPTDPPRASRSSYSTPPAHPPFPIPRRTLCRPASIRYSGRNSPPMAWCSRWRDNWAWLSSGRSTIGRATPTSRTVAASRHAPETSSVDLPTRKSADTLPNPEGRYRPLPALLALGLGSVLRTTDRQPLPGLRRSERQREHGWVSQGGIDLLHGAILPRVIAAPPMAHMAT